MRTVISEKLIREIAAATLKNGGVAFKLDTCRFIPPGDIWSFPKYPGRTAILPCNIDLVAALKDFISTNEQLLLEPDCWLGTWINLRTNEYYLDIATGCDDLEEARKKAMDASQHEGRRIVAIFNSKQNRTIFL